MLGPHFAALDEFLRAQIADFEPEIRTLASYCIDTSGKRIRPALVFFSGWQGEGEVDEDLVRLGAIIEMVHLATLVHDDIMDHADVRRGRRTVSREFGPDAAVLLGDALFAHALSIASEFPTTEVCRHVSVSTRRVCTGEIMQTLAAGDVERNLAYYRRVIDLKTAELFAVSCFLGSRLNGLPVSAAEAVGLFGRHLGAAYQIYDDLADFFGTEAAIGKTLGTDLASGKMTLPLLLLLERLPQKETQILSEEIERGDAKNIGARVGQMIDLGVFEQATSAIRDEVHAGLLALESARSPGAKWLARLANLLLERAEALRA